MTPGYHGDRFVARVNRRRATPLVVVLVCVEVSDLVFAVDSIPAIFAVTLDPFIVYTSNVFAILGLRRSTSCWPGWWTSFTTSRRAWAWC